MTTACDDSVSEPSPTTVRGVSRRRTLTGAATVGLTLPLLAACGDDEAAVASDPASAPGPSTEPSTEPSSSAPSEPDAEPTADAGGDDVPADTGVVGTADVPVGGGIVITDSRVVVTQPSAGDFKCFTAVCTHTGCLVGGVSTTISCPCHGSTFDISTGEVLGGPASAPLAAVDFTINEDQVVLS